MDTRVSTKAWRIARFWAEGHNRSEVVIRGFARQVQDHLDHNGDPDHLHRVALALWGIRKHLPWAVQGADLTDLHGELEDI
ncbi:hypothetical protein, partial [Streptomyces scabiei]|uniref:hypothetical protein n=1 Tax=Streptomyces scabiei TaxID=1930 RepID=UPI0029B37EA8